MKHTEKDAHKHHPILTAPGAGEKVCSSAGLASGLCSLPQLKLVSPELLQDQIREACLLVNEWSLILSQTSAEDVGIAHAQLTRLLQMQEDLVNSLRALPQPAPGLWLELAEFETLVLNFRLSLEYRIAVA